MNPTALLFVSLIWCVHSQSHIKNEAPVYLLDQHYIVIDGYHGNMDSKTLELFGNVETLDFRNCNFTSFSESYVHPLENLQKVIFSNCFFARARDDISASCKKLREAVFIDSDVGELDEVIFKKLAGMKSLQRFYMIREHVPTLFANALAGSNLRKLEIMNSNMDTIQDGAFNGMDKLEVLNLRRNKLKTIPTSSLAAVKTLKTLNLEGNLLEKITTADFPSLPNLEKLNIGHNPVKEINLKGLKEKMPNINRVEVSGIEIDPAENEGIPLLKMEVL